MSTKNLRRSGAENLVFFGSDFYITHMSNFWYIFYDYFGIFTLVYFVKFIIVFVFVFEDFGIILRV